MPLRRAVLALLLGAAMLHVPAARADESRPFTVVAVVDGGFTPYHAEFLAYAHPWNTDDDTANNFSFSDDPATYIEGHPGGTPLPITIPFGTQRVDNLHIGIDKPVWDSFERSTADDVNLYWFPRTKIIGAVNFSSGDFFGGNNAHGTRTAASAAGNTLGTCAECVFVLVNGTGPEALAWAASQPWIDVVTNSYGKGLYTTNDPARLDPTGRVPRSVVRDNIYFGSPIDATRRSSEAGQTVVFSAGNGWANAFVAPVVTYWSSEKGPDWIVTVGAVSSDGKQTAAGAGKPVDISSIGVNYPSTGGNTVWGRDSHSGTSNAAPVVAGYMARVVQASRELFGDTTSGYQDGIVASGQPVACGDAAPGCPLGDGELTRAEVQEIVFKAARPSETRAEAPGFPTVPTTPYAYAYQGHGVLSGRLDGTAGYESEWGQMLGVATGGRVPYQRPPGEANWFVVDSKCRQRLWGSWSGGYYTGTEPVFDPTVDHLAMAVDAACTALPDDTFGPLRPS